MDDILIVASDQEESRSNLQKVLQRLDENGVKLNRDKCECHKESVDFLGYTWSSEGIRISERVVQDVLNAPFPSDHTALRSFLGLASYVCASNVPHASDLLNPLWDFLSRERLESDPEIVQHFQRIKQQIRNLHPRTFFQASKPVVVQADASGYGLGAVLLQEGKPVLYASRKLTSAEQRYSQIEKECLALVFATHRFRNFLLARRFSIQTDHKPLLRILEKPVDSISMRLRRWILAL